MEALHTLKWSTSLSPFKIVDNFVQSTTLGSLL